MVALYIGDLGEAASLLVAKEQDLDKSTARRLPVAVDPVRSRTF